MENETLEPNLPLDGYVNPESKRMLKSHDTTSLDTALLAAKSQYKPLIKTRENPYFKSKYADLSDVFEAVEDALTANGVLVMQSQDFVDDKFILNTELVHAASGQYRASFISLKPKNNDPQELGKLSTYLRRYAVSTLAGVAPDDDDDGNAASGKQLGQPKYAQNTPPATKPLVAKPKPEVNQEPVKPTETERPAEKVDSGLPTKEQKADINARLKVIREASVPAKVNEFVLKTLGLSKEELPSVGLKGWLSVIERLESAKAEDKLKELVGA